MQRFVSQVKEGVAELKRTNTRGYALLAYRRTTVSARVIILDEVWQIPYLGWVDTAGRRRTAPFEPSDSAHKRRPHHWEMTLESMRSTAPNYSYVGMNSYDTRSKERMIRAVAGGGFVGGVEKLAVMTPEKWWQDTHFQIRNGSLVWCDYDLGEAPGEDVLAHSFASVIARTSHR